MCLKLIFELQYKLINTRKELICSSQYILISFFNIVETTYKHDYDLFILSKVGI